MRFYNETLNQKFWSEDKEIDLGIRQKLLSITDDFIDKLDLHGVKKEVTIPFTFKNNTFNGSFSVSRFDYNVGPTTGMAGKVGEKMTLEISVPVSK